MNEPALLLVLLDFGAIGLLTVTFFRRERRRLGVKWWATAVPNFLCPAVLIGGYLAGAAPLTPAGWTRPLALAAVAVAATGLALMFLTRGTHRIPIALFHQDGVPARHLVTYGAYGRIRHPFYTSYILVFAAAAAVFPHWSTLGILGYVLVSLNLTAAGEERRLAASEFGAEYRRYMARTGRFLPRPGTRPGGEAGPRGEAAGTGRAASREPA